MKAIALANPSLAGVLARRMAAEILSTGEVPMKRRIAVAAIAAIMLAAPAALALNAALPAYQTDTGISGEIKSVGSDTLNSEMELWAKGFKERYAIGLRCPINRKLSLTQQVGSVELFRSPPPGVVGYEVLASLPLGAGADTASMA